MIEVSITQELLNDFLLNIRYEDFLELKAVFGDDYKNKFLESCLKYEPETYFLLTDDFKPLAIGGASIVQNSNHALIWLLCTNELEKNKKELFSYIKNKIAYFKKKFNVLYNFIYKSNFNSLKWLKRFDFKVFDLNNPDYKLFYYSKGVKNFDIRYFTC